MEQKLPRLGRIERPATAARRKFTYVLWTQDIHKVVRRIYHISSAAMVLVRKQAGWFVGGGEELKERALAPIRAPLVRWGIKLWTHERDARPQLSSLSSHPLTPIEVRAHIVAIHR